ncbi:acyl-CoA thioesterase [Gemmatimonas phototrophica]|uniref:Thioesterase n=1 Tax=Gemmatimonas phototrophica TaxID=1379270 RepID=A0A143BNA0_9BACT|nr:thioesterase family protein [Gemmatimonas phototrophica]AMW06103.1 thioesterase [Gemmatimonas phototrophica]
MPLPIRPLADFPRHATDKLRYADTDRQGHVNNATFSTFLETGRVEVLYDPQAPLAHPDGEFVIASLMLEFRGEIQWPGTVTIGTGVARVGASSVTLTQAVYQDDRCVALAETVIVHISTATRRGMPLDEPARVRLAGWQVRDVSGSSAAP